MTRRRRINAAAYAYNDSLEWATNGASPLDLDQTGERPAQAIPSFEATAAFLGVGAVADGGNVDLGGLRKPLPGYGGVLQAAAAQLADESASGQFSVRGVPADALLELAQRQRRMSAVEALVAAVHRSVVVQRALIDDRAIGMLRKLGRSVRQEESSVLELRWAHLIEYLAAFAGGGSVRRTTNEATADAPPAAPEAPAADAPV